MLLAFVFLVAGFRVYRFLGVGFRLSCFGFRFSSADASTCMLRCMQRHAIIQRKTWIPWLETPLPDKVVSVPSHHPRDHNPGSLTLSFRACVDGIRASG